MKKNQSSNLNELAESIMKLFQDTQIHPFDAIVLLELLKKNILEGCTKKNQNVLDSHVGYL